MPDEPLPFERRLRGDEYLVPQARFEVVDLQQRLEPRARIGFAERQSPRDARGDAALGQQVDDQRSALGGAFVPVEQQLDFLRRLRFGEPAHELRGERRGIGAVAGTDRRAVRQDCGEACRGSRR